MYSELFNNDSLMSKVVHHLIALNAKGEYLEAISAAQKQLEINPRCNDAFFWLELTLAYANIGDEVSADYAERRSLVSDNYSDAIYADYLMTFYLIVKKRGDRQRMYKYRDRYTSIVRQINDDHVRQMMIAPR